MSDNDAGSDGRQSVPATDAFMEAVVEQPAAAAKKKKKKQIKPKAVKLTCKCLPPHTPTPGLTHIYQHTHIYTHPNPLLLLF